MVESTSYLSLTNYTSVYLLIVLLHNPFLFNNLIYPTFKSFFDGLVIERKRCFYFIIFKQIKGLTEKAVGKKITLSMMDLNETLMNAFLKHYFIITVLGFLRYYHYYLYKVFKYLYYYENNYIFEMIDYDKARKNINKLVTSGDWTNLAKPEVVHALICISQKDKYVEKLLTQWNYKLIQFFCIWSLSSFTHLYFLGIILILLFEYPQLSSWVDIVKKSIIFIGTYLLTWIFPNYILFSAIIVFNTRWIDNGITKKLYEFIALSFPSSNKDKLDLDGCISL